MSASLDTQQTIRSLSDEGYKYGFVTDIESDSAPPGLSEDTVRFISAKKGEPEWLLDWRLAAFRAWREMTEPDWAKVKIAPIDYQASTYYSAPKQQAGPTSLDEVDPELLAMYEKLGIPLKERAALAGVEPVGVAVDAVFDSVSVATTFKRELGELGIIFCSFGEAVREHPELVRRYLGSVVPQNDNFFAALNSAVFSDGSFAYIPPGVRCPMELSTYFRINAAKTGQFERTLLIADKGAYRPQHPPDDHHEGRLGGAWPEHLSRARAGAAACHRRAQLHAMRLAADRRPLRRAHRALYRGAQPLGPGRARGDDLEDQRG